MTEEDKIRQVSILESVLFAHGEPLTEKKLAEILGLEEEQLKEILLAWQDRRHQDLSSGLVLIRNGSEVQLATRSENSLYVEKLFKDNSQEELSQASLEVLTIILYRGPISRPEIDFIRGVNSSYILKNLVMRGLVTREKRGLSFSYWPSFEFLRLLGVSGQAELPDFESLSQKLKSLVEESNQENS